MRIIITYRTQYAKCPGVQKLVSSFASEPSSRPTVLIMNQMLRCRWKTISLDKHARTCTRQQFERQNDDSNNDHTVSAVPEDMYTVHWHSHR